eukprot:Pgem_evm1s10270
MESPTINFMKTLSNSSLTSKLKQLQQQQPNQYQTHQQPHPHPHPHPQYDSDSDFEEEGEEEEEHNNNNNNKNNINYNSNNGVSNNNNNNNNNDNNNGACKYLFKNALERSIKRTHKDQMLGMEVLNGTILKVKKDSAAAIAGISAGFQIIEINGVNVIGVAHVNIMILLAHAPELHLKKLEDNGKECK